MDIIAHRGASHAAPENTAAAVRLAWTEGADAVEVDVHLTRDGRLAVIHDEDTRRTAGVAREVAQCTLAELQRYDVGRWKSAEFAGERIPALDDILPLVPSGKRIFVEVKGGPEATPAVVAAIAAAETAGTLRRTQVALIAFNYATACALKNGLRPCEVCWLAEWGDAAPLPTLEALEAHARAGGLDGIDVDARWMADGAAVRRILDRGSRVYAWTVDDPALGRHIADLRVTGLTTNRPGWMRAQLARP